MPFGVNQYPVTMDNVDLPTTAHIVYHSFNEFAIKEIVIRQDRAPGDQIRKELHPLPDAADETDVFFVLNVANSRVGQARNDLPNFIGGTVINDHDLNISICLVYGTADRRFQIL